MRPLLLAILLASLAATPAAARDKQAEAAALTPVPGEKARSCIPLTAIRETRVRDDRTIDFYMRGGDIYRSTLPHACPQLGFERSFGYGTSLSQLCSTDIITVLRQGGGPVMRGASCGLGEFQPVRDTGAHAGNAPTRDQQR